MRLPPLSPGMPDQKVRGTPSGKTSGRESRKRAPPTGGRIDELRPSQGVLIGINEGSGNVLEKYSGDKSRGHALRSPGLMSPGLRSPGLISPGQVNEHMKWMSGRRRAIILVLIVAAFVVIQTFMQGSILMHLRGIDISKDTGDVFKRAGLGATMLLPQEFVKFVPQGIVERLLSSTGQIDITDLRKQSRSAARPACLALVCPNLGISPQSLYMLTVAKGLQLLGYKLEVLSLEEGDLRFTYENMGVTVLHIQVDPLLGATVDWLNYEAVFAMSLDAKVALTSLARTPFRTIPVIWVIMTDTLGAVLGKYESKGAKSLLYDWSRSFRRADVVVFPNYALSLIYTSLDSGNFYVIPGSPVELWESKVYIATHDQTSLRSQFNVDKEHYVIAVVGSPFLHHNEWREHAFVMQALTMALSELSVGGQHVRMFILGHSNSSSQYSSALQAMAQHLGLSNGMVEYVGVDRDLQGILWISNVVLYATYLDEQAFPPILTRAMGLQRLVIAPDQAVFREYIKDGKNGLVFPIGDQLQLSKALIRAKSSQETLVMASAGEMAAHDLLVLNVTLGYAKLLENLIKFSPEVALPPPLEEVSKLIDKGWCWELMSPLKDTEVDGIITQVRTNKADEDMEGSGIVADLEDKWTQHNLAAENGVDTARALNSAEEAEIMVDVMREQEKFKEMESDAVRIEQDELVERFEPREETWEEVTKNLRKTEVHRDRLREIADGELERTGQPLCIYEPYYGAGAWAFLHEGNRLYRGLSLSTVGRRLGDDDVDAQVRLPALLSETYYRNLLGDYGAILAIGNRIDRIHKNPWIGFQPWRALSKNMALSPDAEGALKSAVQTGRDGDALYFWAYNDVSILGDDQQQSDFWAMCDVLNNGNCRKAYLEAFRHMYGLPDEWLTLPQMPSDGSPWSAMHCWTLPTSSFVELVLFSRIFVDALDSRYYKEQHDLGECFLARSNDQGEHCYCQLLEGLVNVWAYHSARRMIYVDARSGEMKEVHKIASRRGHMWINWFSRETLKSLDDDLAEAVVDGDIANDHWLWPLTGEVYWRGIVELERRERWRIKAEKLRLKKERQKKMQERKKFKSIGKYVKPKPEEGSLQKDNNERTV